MRTPWIDKTFESNYEIETGKEFPTSTEQLFYYPQETFSGIADGYSLVIRPKERQPWRGIFARGDLPGPICRVYTTPNPDYFCLILNGIGYWVCSFSPNRWTYVECTPILDTHVFIPSNIILFSSFNRVVGYGPDGPKWTTDRISLDGFKIIALESGLLKGEFENPVTNLTYKFKIDLETGKRVNE